MPTPQPAAVYGFPVMSVVGDCFCLPYPVELVVTKKHHGLFGVSFEVFDVNGNLFLKIDGINKNLHKKCVMRNSTGFPIITIRKKGFLRQSWSVHRGGSCEENNILFRVKQSQTLQMRTRTDVFLANNTSEDISNFQVVGTYDPSQVYRVYRGGILIAEMHNNTTWGSFYRIIEKFKVKVHPGVDYAFIISLLVIISENDLVLCVV